MNDIVRDNRGMVLVLSFFVILILAGLASSFYYKQINHMFLVRRYINSTRALWAAEAGIQDVRDNKLNGSSVSGTVGNANYTATINRIGLTNYYQVVSQGTAGNITRVVKAVVSTRDVDSNKFKYGIESNVDIIFKGSSKVWGENTTPNPPPAKTRDPNYYKENSIFSFADLFGFSTTEIKSLSNIYNQTFPSGNFSGINWVIAPKTRFTGNVYGSGILIIEGDCRIAGTINFDGVIYVMGELDMSGTSFVNGSILVESAANVDTTVSGTADIQHNYTKISQALDNIRFRSPRIVSWEEVR
ncbi:MAG: hypothetical protein N2606_03150 [Candidatus Omnitrophica bacterium]|nr:hypothetical protein [Candidatus Omnitrophota bacterium]